MPDVTNIVVLWKTRDKQEKTIVDEESFEIAAALGSPMPAPSGSLVVALWVLDYDAGDIVMEKQFRSLEEAKTALARWCLQQWEEWGFCPWKNERGEFEKNADVWRTGMSSRLDGKTPKDVVKKYFAAEEEKLYHYKALVVRREPEWSGGQEVNDSV